MRPDEVEPIEVGELGVSSGGRRVRFTLGSFERGEQTSVQVAERLILDLVDGKGNVLENLTFPGGARELMPAEYAYTLPRGSLPDGDFKFRVRAWAPRQDEPTTRTSRRPSRSTRGPAATCATRRARCWNTARAGTLHPRRGRHHAR